MSRVCATLCGDVSEIRALKATRYDLHCSHVLVSPTLTHISRVSSILAEEMDLRKSSVVLRHILTRSFDAAYRVDGKSFRVFGVPFPGVLRQAGGCAHSKLCTDFLYLILDKSRVRCAPRRVSVLRRRLPRETDPETRFSR